MVSTPTLSFPSKKAQGTFYFLMKLPQPRYAQLEIYPQLPCKIVTEKPKRKAEGCAPFRQRVTPRPPPPATNKPTGTPEQPKPTSFGPTQRKPHAHVPQLRPECAGRQRASPQTPSRQRRACGHPPRPLPGHRARPGGACPGSRRARLPAAAPLPSGSHRLSRSPAPAAESPRPAPAPSSR